MNLNNRINLQFLLISSLAFVLGAILSFYLLSSLLYWDAKDKLTEKSAWAEENIRNNPDWSGMYPYIDVIFDSIKRPEQFYILDTLMCDPGEPEEEEIEPFFILHRSAFLHGRMYQITMRQTMLDYRDLLWGIAPLFCFLFLLILAIMYGVNTLLFRKIWKPFHQNLQILKDFNVQTLIPLVLADSSVQEFQQLKTSLSEMTLRMQRDFRNMKEFTENAAHELQTPLAVMRSKIEALLQEDGLSEMQIKGLAAVYEQVNRLRSLNNSLLFLAKIENKQFVSTEGVDALKIMAPVWETFEDLAAAKGLDIEQQLRPCSLSCHPELLYSCFKNLLENAVKYTQSGGKIKATLTPQSFKVENAGLAAIPQAEHIFERFSKGQEQAPNATGLGLAIVKQIADIYNWKLNYRFEKNMHLFELIFKKG
jgi:two-component system OmpR family sensor kinase